jgi:hypothetical protein
VHVLNVISGPAAGTSVPLDSEIVIGRDADLSIDDPALSRRHAAVRPDGDGVVVEDLDSSNGTYVDGEQISGAVPISPGMTLSLGSSEIAVDVARARRRPKGRLLATLLLLAAIVAGAAWLLTRDDGAETHRFQGSATAAIASQPAPRMTILALVRGEPIGEMSAIITRDVDAFNEPGGPPAHLRLNILFSQPDGSFRGVVEGTVRVTEQGTEIVRGKADVTEGTGKYEGISGTFTLAGNNPPRTLTSRFTLRGTLEF